MRSHLLTASTIGLPLFCSMEATSRSSAVTPAVTSHMKTMTSAVSMAISAWVRICASIASSVRGSIPPVSTMVITLPFHSASQ